jgi:hypothetical protein
MWYQRERLSKRAVTIPCGQYDKPITFDRKRTNRVLTVHK